MRNTRREVWADYVIRVRAATGLSGNAFGRRIGVSGSTVSRWEKAEQVPETPEALGTFAQAFALDLEDVMAAAGLRPGTTPAAPAPTPAYDEDLADVLTARGIDEATRQLLIERILDERERDLQRRKAWARDLIDAERRRAS